jgi:DegV family protein with EDD domain
VAALGGIQVVTDSTAAFTRQEIDAMHLEIVPLSIHHNGEVIDEGLPDTYPEFFRRLAESKVIPTTSQPAVGRFQEVYKRALDAGKEVISIHLSSGLSGTPGSAQMAADLVGPDRITVVDSMNAVSNLKHLVKLAWDEAQKGTARKAIAEMIAARTPTMFAAVTVADLIYLKRGGRLNNSQYFVGKLLNVLPVIQLREGKLYPFAKVMGYKAMLAAMQKVAPDCTKGITVLHIDNIEGAQELRNLLSERFPQIEIGVEPISPVIGSHLGPGAFGYCYYY